MIRLASFDDAEQLLVLNEQFNGKGETTLEEIKNSLSNNSQEIIVVAEEENLLVGFVCVQIKRSFCYSDVYAEITEVFVEEKFRRKGLASKMITFAENYCRENYKLHSFELLTGKENTPAQKLYRSIGYTEKSELLFGKNI
ncbi:MAG: GNAT family N-acetyltransferase [Eubacterium sp.]